MSSVAKECRTLFWDYMEERISREAFHSEVSAIPRRQGNLFRAIQAQREKKTRPDPRVFSVTEMHVAV
jgi:hypothetical protein